MRAPVDYAALLPQVGLAAADGPHLLAAAAGSWARLCAARHDLSQETWPEGLAIFALGSLGRLEASPASDLDLAVVYRRGACDHDAAERARPRAVDRLRALGFDVADKTFRRPLALEALLGEIGGHGDSNEHLTYRALLLTEGAWLAEPAQARAAVDALFGAYTRDTIARGRYLSALSNDLQRYYRTVCVDYRFKVDVVGKAWALRNLKLRHSRKLWHLANLVLFCWAAQQPDDDAREPLIAAHLGDPPLARVILGISALGGARLCAPLCASYDRFLGALADPARRRRLDLLSHAERARDPDYRELHANAERFDAAAQAILAHLWEHSRAHLLRFGLL
ncbi:MAG: hypothetical protein IPK80_30825 [Nannocystis sp.]|nr:hypothetical protein [Nannocystis sp.]